MISPAILEFMALQTRKRSRGFEQGELYISELQRLKLKILSTAAGAEKAEVSQREKEGENVSSDMTSLFPFFFKSLRDLCFLCACGGEFSASFQMKLKMRLSLIGFLN
jgi:hypothetical protein